MKKILFVLLDGEGGNNRYIKTGGIPEAMPYLKFNSQYKI